MNNAKKGLPDGGLFFFRREGIFPVMLVSSVIAFVVGYCLCRQVFPPDDLIPNYFEDLLFFLTRCSCVVRCFHLTMWIEWLIQKYSR